MGNPLPQNWWSEASVWLPEKSRNNGHWKIQTTKFLEYFCFVFNLHFYFAVAFGFNFPSSKMAYHLFSIQLTNWVHSLGQNRWSWTKTMLYYHLRSNSRTLRGQALPFCLLCNRKVIIKCPQEHISRNYASLIIPQLYRIGHHDSPTLLDYISPQVRHWSIISL